MDPYSLLSRAHTSISNQKAKRTKLAGEGDGGVGTLSDEQRRSQRADVMETAKLVATCTAAATAALLGSGGTDMVSYPQRNVNDVIPESTDACGHILYTMSFMH